MEPLTQSKEDIKDKMGVEKICILNNNLSKKDNDIVSYVVEKTSKIASVTFMLANVLNESNPLRIELEKSALGLIKDSSKGMLSIEHREYLFQQMIALVATLEVAGVSGRLSKMNTEILSDEITALGELIMKTDWYCGRRFLDSTVFGKRSAEQFLTREPVFSKSETSNGHVIKSNERSISQQQQVFGATGRTHEDDIKDNEHKRHVQFRDRVQEVQKDRRAIILGLLQRKDRINVKDVSYVIKDCSEKTIQRELLALVRQGVLHKEGERRWSTYRLR